MKTFIAAFALAFALASPAFAQSSELLAAPAAQSAFAQAAPATAGQANRHGGARAASPYSAYGAVTPFGTPAQAANAARETAVRDCNRLAAPYREMTWGSMQIQQYRSCMAQHGQAE